MLRSSGGKFSRMKSICVRCRLPPTSFDSNPKKKADSSTRGINFIMIFASLIHVCRALEIVDKFSRHEACGETGFVFNRRNKCIKHYISRYTSICFDWGLNVYVYVYPLCFLLRLRPCLSKKNSAGRRLGIIFLLVVSDSSNASQS